MGWIGGEVLTLSAAEARSWLEIAYFAIGLLLVLLGFAAWSKWSAARPGSHESSVQCGEVQSARRIEAGARLVDS
jgi:hypothetical protein